MLTHTWLVALTIWKESDDFEDGNAGHGIWECQLPFLVWID